MLGALEAALWSHLEGDGAPLEASLFASIVLLAFGPRRIGPARP